MTKGSSKKKKKNEDFLKPKLKIGRKLKKNTNVTDTTFKARKIILPSNQFDRIQIKPTDEARITGDYISQYAIKLKSDNRNHRVEAIKRLKQILLTLQSERLNIDPFLSIIFVFLRCAITHINTDISHDAKTFLEDLLNTVRINNMNELLPVILSRVENVAKLTVKDWDIMRIMVKKIFSKTIEKKDIREINWTENLHVELPSVATREPELNINLSFQTKETEDLKMKFKKIAIERVKNELDAFSKSGFSKDKGEVHEREKSIYNSCLEMAVIFDIEVPDEEKDIVIVKTLNKQQEKKKFKCDIDLIN